MRRTFPLLLVAACAAPGDRAASGTCPEGEVCSPLTPSGLSFQGLRYGEMPFDSGLHPTAAGGSQMIAIRQGQDGDLLAAPYTPLVDDDTFTATARGPIVTLAAAAQAATVLRIVDTQGELMDRIAISAQTPFRLELRSTNETLEAGHEVALAAGATRTLVVAILTATGGRLADGELAITATGATVGPVPSWDGVTLTAPASGAARIDATTGSGLSAGFDLPIASPTAIVGQPHPALAVGSSTVVCASARAGDRQVLGLAWTWGTVADLDVAPLTGLSDNCALVTPRRPGTFAVPVSVPGAAGTVTLSAGAARLAPAPAAPAADDGAGDRAKLVDG